MPVNPETQAPTRASRRHRRRADRRQAQQLAEQLAAPVAEGAHHPHRAHSVQTAPITLPDLAPLASAVQRGTQAPAIAPAIQLAPLAPIAPAPNHAEAARRQAASHPVAPSQHTPTHHTVVAPGDRVQAPELAKLTDAAVAQAAAAIAQGGRHARRAGRSGPATPNAILGGQGVADARQAAREHVNTPQQRHAHQRALVHDLREKTIPRLERRAAKLSTVDPLGITSSAGDPLGMTSDVDRATKLAAVQEQLTTATDRANNLSGLINQRRGRRGQNVTALEVAAALAGAIPPVKGAELLGLGARALFRGGAEAAPRVAAEVAPRAAGEVAGTAARDVAAQAVERTVPQAVRAGAKTGAKGVARAVTYPIRHPLKTAKYNAIAEAPFAIASGHPGEALQNFLSGHGVVASALTGVGGAIGNAVPSEAVGNLVKDVFDLPAQAIPSIYMPIAGIVEAAQGDPSRLDALWKSYTDTGLIPAIVSGDPAEVLARIKAHPLFLGLEARGAQAVIGRGAGAVMRSGALGETAAARASTAREPLEIGGGLAPAERSFSPDVIEKLAQVVADRHRGKRFGGQIAAPERSLRDPLSNRERILAERVDTLVAAEEGARRAGRSEQTAGAVAVMPKREVDQAGVSLAVHGITTSPERMKLELATYARKLDAQAEKMRAEIKSADGDVSRSAKIRLKQNRALHAIVEKVRDEGDPEAIFQSSRANVVALRGLDEQLKQLGFPAGRLEAARLIPFAREHAGAEWGPPKKVQAQIETLRKALDDPKLMAATAERMGVTQHQFEFGIHGKIAGLAQKAQLIDREGNPLKPDQIKKIAAEMGADDPAYVSQSPSAMTAGDFYRSFAAKRPTLGSAKRTGKATVEGLFDPSYETVARQRIRTQGIADAVRGYGRTMTEFAVARKGGAKMFDDYKSADLARQHPEEFGLPTDMELVPKRLSALEASSSEVEAAQAAFESLDFSNQRGLENIIERLHDEASKPGPGPVVLIPKIVDSRLREHTQSATTFRRTMQVISSNFKGVVLPLSPKWLLGNFVDMSMRSMLSGTTPYGLNTRLGKRLIAEAEQLDPETGKRIKATLTPGTLFGAADNTRVFRDARQFQGTVVAPFARALGSLRRAPGIRNMVNGYIRYRDFVFGLNERLLERPSQFAQVGKEARRELQATTGHWHSALGVGEDALHDLAKGLLKTPKQIQYAKAVEQTLGQWSRNSPQMRAFLADYAPFGMWTRAATKFVLMTLPAHHPIFTALGAIAYEATEQQREQMGLSIFLDRRLPDSVQGSIPTGPAERPGMIPVSGLTSFGYFNDIQKNVASSFLPQFPIAELAGLDWTSDRLTNADGTPATQGSRLLAALGAMGEAYVPFVALGKRMADKGPAQALNPIRPYDPGLVAYLIGLSQSRAIQVPAHATGSTSTTPAAPASGYAPATPTFAQPGAYATPSPSSASPVFAQPGAYSGSP